MFCVPNQNDCTCFALAVMMFVGPSLSYLGSKTRANAVEKGDWMRQHGLNAHLFLLLSLCYLLVSTEAQYTAANYSVTALTDSVTESAILIGFAGTATVQTVQFYTTGEQYMDTSTCPAGAYAVTNASTCSQCGAGKYSPSTSATGADTCLACDAGTYSETVGASSATVCQSCPSNTYYNGTGGDKLGVCVSCPPLSSSYAGSKTLSSCVCNPGYSGANGGSCFACGPGTWCMNGVSNACPVNSNSSALSSSLSQCLCKPGYFGDTSIPTPESATLCQVCSPHFFYISPSSPDSPHLYPFSIIPRKIPWVVPGYF